MNIITEIKKLKNRLHRLECCIQNIGGGGDDHTIAHQALIITDLVVGMNTIPHGISGDVRSVFPMDSDNRQLEFADMRFDNTNIYIKSDEAMNNVKILVIYEV